MATAQGPTDAVGPEPETGADAASTIVQFEDISKRFEGVQALDGVSLDIYQNEILALVGDNGAGKSTLIKILAGVLSPTAGQVYLRNDGELQPRSLDTPNDAKAAGIETVFQNLELSTQHDVASNVFLGREPVEDGWLGRVFRLIDRAEMEARATGALEDIGFRVDPKAITAELSGGQQQAVAVARALVSDPRIMLLDEPTAEVSVEGSEQILDLIERLQDEGRTVVFISHNLQEVFEVADRIAVLRAGKLAGIRANDRNLSREDIVGMMTGAITVDDGQDGN
jgi:ABC-type sugar transport system ATPase subunit